jgi:predicted nucleic acid-binding protein
LRIYLDTSYLLSLYCADRNSPAAAALIADSRHEHVISTFCEVEAVNALQLRVSRKEISAKQAKASWDDLVQDLRSQVLTLLSLPDAAFERARALSLQATARLGTRTADLLHVAAALEMGAERLYSFDRQQRKLAQAVRLKVNP